MSVVDIEKIFYLLFSTKNETYWLRGVRMMRKENESHLAYRYAYLNECRNVKRPRDSSKSKAITKPKAVWEERFYDLLRTTWKAKFFFIWVQNIYQVNMFRSSKQPVFSHFSFSFFDLQNVANSYIPSNCWPLLANNFPLFMNIKCAHVSWFGSHQPAAKRAQISMVKMLLNIKQKGLFSHIKPPNIG